MKIEEIPVTLRPREKALANGISSLSDRELLALYVRNGSKKGSALDLADQILNLSGGLPGLRYVTRSELVKLHGVQNVKATEILALIEISKRLNEPLSHEKNILNNPLKIVQWVNGLIGYEKQEIFMILCLDVHMNVIEAIELFKGTLNMSQVHPRDIFREAIERNTYQIVLVHNHPSGSLDFSHSDLEVTKALVQSGKMIGISIVDHILVASGSYASLRELRSEIFQNDAG
ncbi:hypothetical protein AOC36_05365 [Erysipelothrix larvae]|uniref:MPN domain-containing protein n=1 Tax=Erysipelothrix larvae TaxID=1514105 RepID=A0A0X8GZS0_9FIRM|nr:DNA repair protein RadC [Erysipelothrix larvae]AMC93427.1 hypothetical protein AOC36_05365 [Erysipelothrix larvae]